MRQHACQHIGYPVMTPQMLIEHLMKECYERRDTFASGSAHAAAGSGCITPIGEYLEAVVNPISICGDGLILLAIKDPWNWPRLRGEIASGAEAPP